MAQSIQQPYKSLLKFVQEFYYIKNSQISFKVTADQDERFTNLCDIFQSLLVKIEKFDFLQELVEQLQNQEQQKSLEQVNKSDKIINLVKIYLEGKKDNYLKFRFDKLFSNSKSKHAASQYLLYKLIDYTPTLLQVYDSVGIQSLKQTTFQRVRAQLNSNKVEPLEFLMLKVFKDKNTAEQNCPTLLKAMELSNQQSALALVSLFELLDLKAAVLEREKLYSFYKNIDSLFKPFQQCRNKLQSGWLIQQMLFQNLHVPGEDSVVHSEDYKILYLLTQKNIVEERKKTYKALRDEFGNKKVAIQQGYKGQKLNVAKETQNKQRIGIKRDMNCGCMHFNYRKDPKP